MAGDIPEVQVHNALAAINKAWRNGQPMEMYEYLHPDITMALPNFKERVVGRHTFLASFVEFCTNAQVVQYSETNETINVIDKVAVASIKFNMVYDRATYRARSSGRDLWVFENIGEKWLAVWRTMIELEESREQRR
ncbi:MAG TPA: DUF4440 domain-containing protein [Candidatus Acidoferrales bacterium]|nr:DUF4440 domain-containing protein [Candidatus Acidoferrales bacterium]